MNIQSTKTYLRIIVLTLIGLAFVYSTYAQGIDFDRVRVIQKRLDEADQKGIQIYNPITISLGGTLHELVAFLNESTDINIVLEGAQDAPIDNTFTNASIRDVIQYLCEVHELEIAFSGDIIRLLPYRPTPPPPVVTSDELDVRYNANTQQISINARNQNLGAVLNEIIVLSGVNIGFDSDVANLPASLVIEKAPLEQVLAQLGDSNNLRIEEKGGFYTLKSKQMKQSALSGGNSSGAMNIQLLPQNYLFVEARDVPVFQIIKEASIQIGVDFVFLPKGGNAPINPANTPNQYGNPQQNYNQPQYNDPNPATQQSNVVDGPVISLKLEQTDFEGLLDYICTNTDLSFYIQDDIYFIGERTAEGVKTSEIIQLEYRSAKGVIDMIPASLKNGITLDTLYELNSIVVTGATYEIDNLHNYIKSIDKLVPVISIELIIVDVQTNKLDEVGIEAGIQDGGRTTGGGIIGGQNSSPAGIDFNFSPNAINGLLGVLSRNNVINLGKVSENFYLNLKALEVRGVVEIESTPKLSTLNSHPALLSIGQKRYYQEQQVNFPGNLNPIPVQANIFKEIEANLEINITPIVSGDDQVTLEIQFEQSEFLEEPDITAPPPQVNREFESLIRIRNGEMIALGGLERETKSNVKSGVPFLSRIPVIGWLFGKKSKSKTKDKLLIFVKATIIN